MRRAAALALAAAVILALPWAVGAARLGAAVEFAELLTLATLWNLLAGYAGIVSIGQQAYVGLGAYALLALVSLADVPPLLALPLAALTAGLAALPLGELLFRLRGPQFAIGSWAVAEAVRLGVAQISALGGGSGQSLPAAAMRTIASDRAGRQLVLYAVAVGLAAGSSVLAWVLLRSRPGLGLMAMRDSEVAAASLGVDVRGLRRFVYVAAACVTGLTGGLIVLQTVRVSPDAAFSVNDWTANVIFITVIGGVATLEGPLIGAAVFFLFRAAFAGYGPWYMIALGALAAAVMLAAPGGVSGALHRRGVRLFPTTRVTPLPHPPTLDGV